MEIRQIRYFLAVAEELNFRRAAERVHITQPALSRQISQLEGDIGVELLSRSNRKVELTVAGREFFNRATRILADLERARLSTQRAAAGQVGVLVVGYIPSASYVIVPQVLKYFREFYPDVEIDLRGMLSQHQFDALLSEKIDVGLLRPWRRIKGLTVQQIVSEPFVVVVPEDHRFAGRKAMPLAAFADEQFIMHARQIPGISLTYDVISRLFEEAGFSPRIAPESPEHMHLALGLVQAGFGLAVVPRSMALVPMPGVAFAELREQSHRSEIAMAWREDRADPRLRQLADFASEALERDLWPEMSAPMMPRKHQQPLSMSLDGAPSPPDTERTPRRRRQDD
jgi:DNA-binding transcriptional LysR family regulator